MNELLSYLSFVAFSILLFIPSLWARRASSRNGFTITAYRIFFTYNVAFMVIYLGISRTGNIPLTDIEDAPFIDLFSFIVALIYGYFMASLRKPDPYPDLKYFINSKTNGPRKCINLNIDHILYYIKASILVVGGSGFYTVIFNYVLSEIISLAPQQWRLVSYITYLIFVALGIWGVRAHHRKRGYTL